MFRRQWRNSNGSCLPTVRSSPRNTQGCDASCPLGTSNNRELHKPPRNPPGSRPASYSKSKCWYSEIGCSCQDQELEVLSVLSVLPVLSVLSLLSVLAQSSHIAVYLYLAMFRRQWRNSNGNCLPTVRSSP